MIAACIFRRTSAGDQPVPGAVLKWYPDEPPIRVESAATSAHASTQAHTSASASTCRLDLAIRLLDEFVAYEIPA